MFLIQVGPHVGLLAGGKRGFKVKISTALLLSVVFAHAATAQDNCASVLKLSKLQDTVVETENDVRLYADRFCREYNSTRSSSRKSKFQAAFRHLSRHSPTFCI